MNEGYEKLKNLVLSYLGVNNDNNQSSSSKNQSNSIPVQRQFSNLLQSRSRTIDEFNKEIDHHPDG